MRIKIHFRRRKKPREAEPFTRFTRRFFAFVLRIFAKRLRRQPERKPVVITRCRDRPTWSQISARISMNTRLSEALGSMTFNATRGASFARD